MKKIFYAPYKFESYGQEEIDAVVESLKSVGWAVKDQSLKSLKKL